MDIKKHLIFVILSTMIHDILRGNCILPWAIIHVKTVNHCYQVNICLFCRYWIQSIFIVRRLFSSQVVILLLRIVGSYYNVNCVIYYVQLGWWARPIVLQLVDRIFSSSVWASLIYVLIVQLLLLWNAVITMFNVFTRCQ